MAVQERMAPSSIASETPPQVRAALFAVLGLLAVIVAVYYLSSRKHVETPEELTNLALNGPTAEGQEQAATRLEARASTLPKHGPRNAAQPYLKRLVLESDNPGVRAAALRGLASIWDYECVDQMFKLLEDPAPLVRYTASRSIAKLMDAEIHFDINSSPGQRAEAAKRLTEQWQTFSKAALPRWQKRLEEKDASL